MPGAYALSIAQLHCYSGIGLNDAQTDRQTDKQTDIQGCQDRCKYDSK